MLRLSVRLVAVFKELCSFATSVQSCFHNIITFKCFIVEYFHPIGDSPNINLYVGNRKYRQHCLG